MTAQSKSSDQCGNVCRTEFDEEAFIVLKELPTLQMLKLKESSEKGETETLVLLQDLLPLILVDHNFYEDEGSQKNENEEVSSLIFESLDLTVKVVSEYTSSSFYPAQEERIKIASLCREVFQPGITASCSKSIHTTSFISPSSSCRLATLKPEICATSPLRDLWRISRI